VKLSRTCHIIFRQITPLKIRGVRGVRVMEITPFIPLTFKGEIERRALILRGILKERPLAC
jgi:hypothetical protein